MLPCVFVDRDDTLIRNADLPPEAWGDATPGDLLKPEYIEALPGAVDACRELKRAGYLVVVFTSQGGVARGHGSLGDVERCHDAMRSIFTGSVGSLIDASYYVPFHPKGSDPRFAHEHAWRKPAPGMIEAARDELGIDLARSWAVGDKERDIEAASAAGIAPERCLLLGRDAPDLASCVPVILGA